MPRELLTREHDLQVHCEKYVHGVAEPSQAWSCSGTLKNRGAGKAVVTQKQLSL